MKSPLQVTKRRATRANDIAFLWKWVVDGRPFQSTIQLLMAKLESTGSVKNQQTPLHQRNEMVWIVGLPHKRHVVPKGRCYMPHSWCRNGNVVRVEMSFKSFKDIAKISLDYAQLGEKGVKISNWPKTILRKIFNTIIMAATLLLSICTKWSIGRLVSYAYVRMYALAVQTVP